MLQNNWVFEGLSLQPNCTTELIAEFDPEKRVICPKLVFTLKEPFPTGFEHEFLTKSVDTVSSIEVPFEPYFVGVDAFSDKLDPVNDPGCVINLSSLGYRNNMLGQAGDFVDMKNMIDAGLTSMIDRNTKKIVRLVNSSMQNANKNDKWFRIQFFMDGGYTGVKDAWLEIRMNTDQAFPLMLHGLPWDLSRFFSIPLLEKKSN